VTSVVLDAARQRFPKADIFLAGPAKNAELFAAEPRIQHLPVDYGRGATLEDRLAVSFALRDQLDQPGTLVIDPDSRLTQLGLIPVCNEDRYLFFESRAYGSDTNEALPELTARWLAETLDIENARPWLAPAPAAEPAPAEITVSLGVGENPAKRVPDPFELLLLKHLAARDVLVDEGASGEERGRVQRALQPGMRTWRGAFAPFAFRIMNSKLYVGYDSAGQHVAAAAGTPLVCIFSGHVSERMFERWKPTGPGPRAILRGDRADILDATRKAIDSLL
jgi:ADP-heptose:LPS heptosyltransferase